VLVEYLEGRGFDVTEAQDGEGALDRIPDFRPHIVLMDVMMTGIGGVEALKRIKTVAPRAGPWCSGPPTTSPSRSASSISTRCSRSTC